MVYKQPLRQTERFVRSLVKLMGVDICVPDSSTFSRRGSGLDLPLTSRSDKAGPIHLVIDSTGLKVFGEGEWLQSRHKTMDLSRFSSGPLRALFALKEINYGRETH